MSRRNQGSRTNKNSDISRLTVLGRSSNSLQSSTTEQSNNGSENNNNNNSNNENSRHDKEPLFCQFLALHRRFGDQCAYLHELPTGKTLDQAKAQIPCPYYARGNCRYGEYCQLCHDPNNLAQNSYQGQQRESKQPPTPCANTSTVVSKEAVANNSSEDTATTTISTTTMTTLTCGICLEDLPAEGSRSMRHRKFGLLSCCDHTFCFDCVMEWRSEGSEEARDRRSCPTCRKHSGYVVPSVNFPTSAKEKEAIVQEYKDRLSVIHCRRFTGRYGSCPFGSICFNAHLNRNGADVKSMDHTMESIRQQRERRRLHSMGQEALASLELMDVLWDATDVSEIEALVIMMRIFDALGHPRGTRKIKEFQLM